VLTTRKHRTVQLTRGREFNGATILRAAVTIRWRGVTLWRTDGAILQVYAAIWSGYLAICFLRLYSLSLWAMEVKVFRSPK
jgi:hypothetical protein